MKFSVLHTDANDIIFENRNKSYGAYQLRKCYVKRYLKGSLWAILTTVLGLLFIYFWIHFGNLLPNNEEEISLSAEVFQNALYMDLPKQEKQVTIQEDNKSKEIVAAKKEEIKPEQPKQSTNKKSGKSDTLTKNDNNGNGEGGSTYQFGKSETDPAFKGGLDEIPYFIQDNFKYPKVKIKANISVSYIIEKNGDITNIHVFEKVNPEVEKAIIDCISKMKGYWTPGKQAGNPVRVVTKQVFELDNL